MRPPICVACEIEYWPHENGATLVLMAIDRPLAAYQCDVWKCPGCRHEIVFGVATEPYSAEWLPGRGINDAMLAADAQQHRQIRAWLNHKERTAYKCKELSDVTRDGSIPGGQ